MTSLTPIETRYRSYRFRSRLEARWAVAFDSMGVTWSYEPEGFVLPSGRPYLPDFRLVIVGMPFWVEVKPKGEDSEPFAEFMEALGYTSRGAVLHEVPGPGIGGILRPEDCSDGCHWSGDTPIFDDGPYQFCACEHCGAVGFEFEARSRRIDCCAANRDAREDNDNVGRYGVHPIIRGAFDAARSARFEHGESGASHQNTGTWRQGGLALNDKRRTTLGLD